MWKTVLGVMLLTLAVSTPAQAENACVEQLRVTLANEKDEKTAMHLAMMAVEMNRTIHYVNSRPRVLVYLSLNRSYLGVKEIKLPDRVVEKPYVSDPDGETATCKRLLTKCRC